MPAEFWTEAASLAIAGAIVATVAVPIGLLTWYLTRKSGNSLLPAWKLWRVPWGGFELTFAFVFVAVLPSLLQLTGLSPLVAGVAALPIQLLFLAAVSRVLYPAWNPFRRERVSPPIDELWFAKVRSVVAGFARLVALAIVAWALLTPVVLLIHGVVTLISSALGLPNEEHPLTKLGGGAGWEHVLFLLQACVAAPLIEEVLFRGLLLAWVIGGRERKAGTIQAAPIVPPAARPIVVMAIVAAYAFFAPTNDSLIFAGVLTTGFALLWFAVRRGKRHCRTIYTSAALFAIVHSAVWPKPIPLFFLGLGLG